MADLVWEEPPPPIKQRHDWRKIARALRARPGEWARVAEYPRRATASMMAHRIREGHFLPMRPVGAFEGASRPSGGMYGVYARYVGEQDGGAR